MCHKNQQPIIKDDKKVTMHAQPFPNQNPNQNHNTKKESLGPNTKR